MSVWVESQIRAHHSGDRCGGKIGITDRGRGTGKEVVGRQYGHGKSVVVISTGISRQEIEAKSRRRRERAAGTADGVRRRQLRRRIRVIRVIKSIFDREDDFLSNVGRRFGVRRLAVLHDVMHDCIPRRILTITQLIPKSGHQSGGIEKHTIDL